MTSSKLGSSDIANLMEAAISRRRFLGGTLAVGAGALSLSSLLAACASSTPTQSASSGWQRATGSTTWATWATDPVSHDAFTQAARAFERETGMTVADSYVDFAQYTAQLPTQLSSASPPGVFMVGANGSLLDFIKKGLVADMTDVWDTAYASQFPASFKAFGQVGGKNYFLPFAWFWWSFLYNKNLFQQKGYQPPTTWNDFMTLLEKIKGDGIVPIAVGAKDAWSNVTYFEGINLRVNGPDFHNQLGQGKVPYTDARVKKTFDTWKELLPYLIPSPAAYGFVDAGTKVASGKAAMMYIGPWMIGTLGAQYASTFDHFWVPQIDSSVQNTEQIAIDGFAPSAKSANVDGAKRLLAYLGGPEAGNIYIKGSASVSSAVPNLKVDPSLYTPMFTNAIAYIGKLKLVVNTLGRIMPPDMATALQNAGVQFILNPGSVSDIQHTLEQARQTAYTA